MVVQSFSPSLSCSYASTLSLVRRVMAETITSNMLPIDRSHLPIYTQKYSLRRLSRSLSPSRLPPSTLHEKQDPHYCCRDDDAVAEWDQSLRGGGRRQRASDCCCRSLFASRSLCFGFAHDEGDGSLSLSLSFSSTRWGQAISNLPHRLTFEGSARTFIRSLSRSLSL